MSTALYRRYRPETFADVIGQEHVTDPLRAALRGDRITHAYLFSGPRGCGKTTSARIFARCLNCAEGPTDTPCGTCPSCVDLARDGAGSLDVVEMDAASHGGVDDARELRERAAFAPARDRYKIFIIDEAHMVTSQGFNALLKLVEEPPAHVKFVFATTEPEKVIGTIRSRTHHYPFRLVPPERLQGYLEELCAAEGVAVATGVLPLVVRAGGGSVRDSLSVLDQLIAGAQDGEVSYERAVALLGYTHATLLDDVVDALAARDGASLFRVVDRVIDSGHDPRRFAEDLLERIRDLVIIAVSGDHAAAVLRSVPADQLERMRVQSQQLGPAELSRAGDLVNDALTEMSGATSPRLQLELLCARLLLPAADDAGRGFGARLDRIERYLSAGGSAASAPAAVQPAPPAAQRPAPAPASPSAAGGQTASQTPVEPTRGPAEPVTSPSVSQTRVEPTRGPARPVTAPADSATPQTPPTEPPARQERTQHEPPATQRPAPSPDRPPAGGASEDTASPRATGAPAKQQEAAGSQEQTRASREPSRPAPAPEPTPATSEAPAQRASAWQRHEAPSAAAAAPPATSPDTPVQPAGGQAGPDADLVRRRWNEVLATLARFKRTTWTLVSQNAHVGEVSGGVLHLAFNTGGLAHTFRTGTHADALQRALLETLGVQLRIEAVLSQAAEGGDQGMPYAAGGWSAAGQPPAEQGWSAPAAPAPAAPAPATPAPATPAAPQPDSPGAPVASPSDEGAPGPSAASPAEPGASEAWSGPPEPDADSFPPDPGPSVPSPEDAAPPAPRRAQAAPEQGQRSGERPWERHAPGGSAQSAASAPESRRMVAPADDTPSMDDPDAENSGLVGAPLIERMLGGTIISED
ncbi:DNA polymerase III subunit gamma and tau [Georgenia sp. 311]|uniref:DNA polymerase III subunit gamma and tau n=1 Tax=Georgenia sp. 311 TaxID=2585134 RepID=UPI001111B696|nr:DNA polymerase III subunit gamma and tau [Georgenia sp. 311]TNC17527.1 DNA polymerase III subunit gamma and tau [Georgenia sp. 311]